MDTNNPDSTTPDARPQYLVWDELSDTEQTILRDAYPGVGAHSRRTSIYRLEPGRDDGALEPLTAADCLRLGLLKGTEAANG